MEVNNMEEMRIKEYREKNNLVVSCDMMSEHYGEAIPKMNAVLERAYRINNNEQAFDECGYLKMEHTLLVPDRVIDLLNQAEQDVLKAVNTIKTSGIPKNVDIVEKDFLLESKSFIALANKFKEEAKQIEDEMASKNPIIKIQDAISSGEFENGDIGGVIFESITDASLSYDDYEFVSIYEDATPKEREILDRMMVSLTGMTMNNIMSEAADKIASRETDKEMDL